MLDNNSKDNNKKSDKNNEKVNNIIKKLTQQNAECYVVLIEINEAITKGEITYEDAIYILFKVKPEMMQELIKNIYGSIHIPLKRINSMQRNYEIQKLYNQNISVKSIAKRFNMTSRRIYQIINQNKLNND